MTQTRQPRPDRPEVGPFVDNPQGRTRRQIEECLIPETAPAPASQATEAPCLRIPRKK